MSLISVQRPASPGPNTNPDEKLSFQDAADAATCFPANDADETRTTTSSAGHKSLPNSECFFIVRGAAVFISRQDSTVAGTSGAAANANLATVFSSGQIEGKIQAHLQSMLRLLRPEDKLSMAVRLQSLAEEHVRYLVVLSTFDPSETKESALIGFDLFKDDKISIGVTVPLNGSTRIELDGDGGITVLDRASSLYVFRPISIKAMWSLFQFLHKELDVCSGTVPFFGGVVSHQWLQYYSRFITTDDGLCSQWHYSPPVHPIDDIIRPAKSSESLFSRTSEQFETEARIRSALREIMQSVDLDTVTTQDIRRKLEQDERMAALSLRDHRDFVDREMLVILGQMDRPSKITDYLYLGTEWNASNWEELRKNKVKYILNMTKEVDNFFPTQFNYLKIWVSDEATTELLMHWQKTYEFIKEAKECKKRVLVHCKKGISRSASTVIAYCMKEYGWGLEKALDYVKERRNCITPNEGFMEQLSTFDGVLKASNNRHSAVFNAPKESDTVSLVSSSSRVSTLSSARVVSAKRSSFVQAVVAGQKLPEETPVIIDQEKQQLHLRVVVPPPPVPAKTKKTPSGGPSLAKASSQTQNKTAGVAGSESGKRLKARCLFPGIAGIQGLTSPIGGVVGGKRKHSSPVSLSSNSARDDFAEEVSRGSCGISEDILSQRSPRKGSLPDSPFGGGRYGGGGRVKQCREQIERSLRQKGVRNTRPTTTSFVSTIAKKLGQLAACKDRSATTAVAQWQIQQKHHEQRGKAIFGGGRIGGGVGVVAAAGISWQGGGCSQQQLQMAAISSTGGGGAGGTGRQRVQTLVDVFEKSTSGGGDTTVSVEGSAVVLNERTRHTHGHHHHNHHQIKGQQNAPKVKS